MHPPATTYPSCCHYMACTTSTRQLHTIAGPAASSHCMHDEVCRTQISSAHKQDQYAGHTHGTCDNVSLAIELRHIKPLARHYLLLPVQRITQWLCMLDAVSLTSSCCRSKNQAAADQSIRLLQIKMTDSIPSVLVMITPAQLLLLQTCKGLVGEPEKKVEGRQQQCSHVPLLYERCQKLTDVCMHVTGHKNCPPLVATMYCAT
jgi:hypothetical protein